MNDHTLKFCVATLIAALLGCGAVTKQKECSELIAKANAALQEIQTLSGSAGDDPASLRKLADAADKHAKALEATEISDEELKKHASGYVQMWKDMAKYSRELADAVDKKDLAALGEASKKLKESTSKEGDLVNAMNSTCSRQ